MPDMVLESMRIARAADAGHVRHLVREAYAKWVPIIGREPLPMAADYDAAIRHHRIDLLCVGDAPAGLIEMISGEDHLLIENVAVLPTFQGRGYGGRLMAHAEMVAASLGFTTIRLYTNKLFAENLRFYASLGYGIDREDPFRGGIVVHMSKPVPRD